MTLLITNTLLGATSSGPKISWVLTHPQNVPDFSVRCPVRGLRLFELCIEALERFNGRFDHSRPLTLHLVFAGIALLKGRHSCPLRQERSQILLYNRWSRRDRTFDNGSHVQPPNRQPLRFVLWRCEKISQSLILTLKIVCQFYASCGISFIECNNICGRLHKTDGSAQAWNIALSPVTRDGQGVQADLPLSRHPCNGSGAERGRGTYNRAPKTERVRTRSLEHCRNHNHKGRRCCPCGESNESSESKEVELVHPSMLPAHAQVVEWAA